MAYCCCPSCSMSWTVLYSEGHRCCGAMVICECLGNNDRHLALGWEATWVCASHQYQWGPYFGGGLVLRVLRGWSVGIEVCWEVTDPARCTTTGEASLYAEYGEAVRWAGNGVKEYALGFSGWESLTDSQINSPERFAVTPLKETCLLITKERPL